MRIPNLTDDEHCRWCCDCGLVAVGTETRPVVTVQRAKEATVTVATGETYEEEVYGPCPACEIGHRVEFPENERPPWGRDGWWRGRSWLDFGLKQACRCDARPADRETMRQWAEFARNIGRPLDDAPQGTSRSPDPGPVSDDPPERAEPMEAAEEEPPPAPAPPDTVPVDAGGSGDEVGEGSGSPASHVCPGFNPPRDVPWSREECAHCTPAQPEVIIL